MGLPLFWNFPFSLSLSSSSSSWSSSSSSTASSSKWLLSSSSSSSPLCRSDLVLECHLASFINHNFKSNLTAYSLSSSSSSSSTTFLSRPSHKTLQLFQLIICHHHLHLHHRQQSTLLSSPCKSQLQNKPFTTVSPYSLSSSTSTLSSSLPPC